MSSSERQLLLSTDNPEAEILLLDGGFKVVARGASPLKAMVPIGIYGVKVLIGDQQNQEVLKVFPDPGPLSHSVPSPRFESAVPLASSSTARSFQQELLSRSSPLTAEASAKGLAVARVCLRDTSDFRPGDKYSSSMRLHYEAVLKKLGLIDMSGTELRYDPDASVVELDRGYISLVFIAPPGAYALTYDEGRELLCIPLPIGPHWVLEAFVGLVQRGDSLAPDFPGMSVFYKRADDGFNPWRSDLIATETVRQSLQRGRAHISAELMQNLYVGKFDNPMLGIYAAHYLRISSDKGGLDVVLSNTATMLGADHPDILALRCDQFKDGAVQDRIAQLQIFKGPPLLAKSWDLLVSQANELPFGSTASNIALSIGSSLCLQGIFVGWRRPKEAQEANAVTRVTASKVRGPAQYDPNVPRTPVPYREAPLRSVVLLTSSLATRLRKAFLPPKDEPTVEVIEAIVKIDSAESAASALKALSKRYDWDAMAAEIRTNADWMLALSPLQRTLVMALRDIQSTDGFGVTGEYVDRLISSHRVPLSALINDLRELELGGWMVEAIGEALELNAPKLQRLIDRFRRS